MSPLSGLIQQYAILLLLVLGNFNCLCFSASNFHISQSKKDIWILELLSTKISREENGMEGKYILMVRCPSPYELHV